MYLNNNKIAEISLNPTIKNYLLRVLNLSNNLIENDTYNEDTKEGHTNFTNLLSILTSLKSTLKVIDLSYNQINSISKTEILSTFKITQHINLIGNDLDRATQVMLYSLNKENGYNILFKQDKIYNLVNDELQVGNELIIPEE